MVTEDCRAPNINSSDESSGSANKVFSAMAFRDWYSDFGGWNDMTHKEDFVQDSAECNADKVFYITSF